MPKAEERNLKKEAKKHGFKPGSDRYNRYVYGTMAKQGRLPRRKKKRAKSRS